MSSLALRSASRCDTAISDELIDACDAKPDQSVMIVGARHIDLLAALCHRRFIRAACQSADGGPHDPEGPADILIIPDYFSETELRSALMQHGRAMNDGGMVVVRIARRLPLSRIHFLHELFAQHGFALLQRGKQLSDGSALRFARKDSGVSHAHAA